MDVNTFLIIQPEHEDFVTPQTPVCKRLLYLPSLENSDWESLPYKENFKIPFSFATDSEMFWFKGCCWEPSLLATFWWGWGYRNRAMWADSAGFCQHFLNVIIWISVQMWHWLDSSSWTSHFSSLNLSHLTV